jgi:hypothetical protein
VTKRLSDRVGPSLPRSRTANPLPKTCDYGAVCVQWVRCGKPSCRCARPHGALHGPYSYLFWRTAGRLRKQYLPAAQAQAVRRACAQRRERERLGRAALREAWSVLNALRARVRDVEQAYARG